MKLDESGSERNGVERRYRSHPASSGGAGEVKRWGFRGLPQRFFTLTHLHNNPKVTDAQMRHYRAGLAKLLNSLSWRKAIVYPTPLDPAGTVLALDLRDLDWDLNQNWSKVIGRDPSKDKLKPLRVEPHTGYPYALTHDRLPDDAELNTLAKQVYQLSQTEVPAVRADWFLATASVPPLYHELLYLPVQIEALARPTQAIQRKSASSRRTSIAAGIARRVGQATSLPTRTNTACRPTPPVADNAFK